MEQCYPSMLDRIKSTTIDTIILIVCMILFTDILGNFENVPNFVRVLLFISLLMYEPICTTFGATIGNDKMKIRVRQNSDSTKRINIFQAIVRFIIKFLFGWISFITMLVSNKKRAIHDFVSGSVMIYKK